MHTRIRFRHIVDGEPIQLNELRRIRLLFAIAAHRERILRHLHQAKEAPFPLLPRRLAHRVAIAAVLEVGRLLHADRNANAQIGVGGGAVLRHCHSIPFGRARTVGRRLNDHLAELFVLEGDEILHLGVELHFHRRQRVLGGEVALSIPSMCVISK